MDGWISFDIGEQIAVDHIKKKEYNIYKVSKIQFELSLEDDDGYMHKIDSGYCDVFDREILQYYGLRELLSKKSPQLVEMPLY